MLETIIPQPSDTKKDHPALLRSTTPQMTLREAVAAQIRYECGARSWSCIVLAEIMQISVSRARDLHAGRRPALLEEIALLCKAVNVGLTDFMDGVEERRARPQRRIFADTTMGEVAQMAGDLGITPSNLLRQQGWMKRTAAEVPPHLGGDA